MDTSVEENNFSYVLKRALYNLNQVFTEYETEISTEETKIVVFLGKQPVSSTGKIRLDGTILLPRL